MGTTIDTKTKIAFAARARTLNRFKQNYHGAQGFALLAHSLLLDDLIMQYEYDKYATHSVRSEKNSELYHHSSIHRTTNTLSSTISGSFNKRRAT